MLDNLNKREKKLAIIRGIIFILITTLIIYVTVKSLPLITMLSNENSRIEFKNMISAFGVRGIFLMLGLQILQIIVAVIPGQPMEVLFGMLYGTWFGMFLCLVGTLMGTMVVFYVVRKIGIDFIQLFFSKEKIEEIKQTKTFKDPQKFEMLLFIIFTIPMIPKDIFVYIGGISPIKPIRFFCIATFARIPGLMLTVYAGNKLSEGRFLVTLVIFISVILIGIIGIYATNLAKKRLEENKKNTKDNQVYRWRYFK